MIPIPLGLVGAGEIFRGAYASRVLFSASRRKRFNARKRFGRDAQTGTRDARAPRTEDAAPLAAPKSDEGGTGLACRAVATRRRGNFWFGFLQSNTSDGTAEDKAVAAGLNPKIFALHSILPSANLLRNLHRQFYYQGNLMLDERACRKNRICF